MSYSFVSIFAFLIIIIVNWEIILKKDYPMKNAKALWAFRFFLVTIVLFLISDILWGFLETLENKVPVTVDTSLYFVFMSALLFGWTTFVRHYLDSKFKFFNFLVFFSGLVFAIYGITMVIINIFHPVLFSYNTDVYTEQVGRHIYLISQAVLFFGTFVICLVPVFYKKQERKQEYLTISSFGLVMAVFTLIQYFFPLYPEYSIGLAVGNVVIHSFVIVNEKRTYRKVLLENQSVIEMQDKEIDTTKQLAYTDPLTGVKNKHAYVELESNLDVLIHDKKISEFSLFIFDLNDLKNINDMYGHDMGDKYIIKSVELISKHFIGATIYRYGGDEFIVILEGTLYQNRYNLFKEFNKEIEHNINSNEPIIALGFSDFVPENDNTVRTVFNRADERMYARKRRLKQLTNQHAQNGDTNRTKAQIGINLRQEMYEMFYRNENFSLVDILNGSSSDEIMEVDTVHDTFKRVYHVQGKYFVPNVGMSFKELNDFTYKYIVHPDDRGAFMGLMKPEGFFERLENARIPNFDFAHFRYKLQDGQYRYVEQVVVTGEQYGIGPGMFRVYVLDIDNLKSRQLGIVSDESNIISVGRDATTGLLTGREFFNKAEEIIKKNNKTQWCLLSLDIEHFKFFDEWFGREKGDLLLAKIGAELNSSVDEFGGVAGYFGSDDFTILMPYDKSKIQKIYVRVHKHITEVGMTAGFLPAIGVAVVEKDMVLVDAFDRATIAASKAKNDLKTRIVEYDYEMQFLAEKEYHLLTDFMRALNNNEITFYLQPQCRVSTGAIVGAEALARWIKSDGKIVPPNDFIPILEKYGFVTDLDKYLWDSVCKNIKEWIDQGHKAVPISLNVSRIDIYNLDIAQYFHNLCAKYDLPHSYLKIEITESAYAEISDTIDELVNKLRNDGFLVLMDDFGSGYSSLNMLSNLKLDAIKLDGKFLEIENGDLKRGVHILESVVNMAKTIGLPIIVEGVETQKQSDFLEEMGCRYVQGYYFYKPMPQEEFRSLMLDEKNIDSRGFVAKLNEQFRLREFLDKNLYSDSMLNNIIGSVAIYSWDKKEHVDIVRFNQQFYEAVGVVDFADRLISIERFVPDEDKPKLFGALKDAMDNRLSGAEAVVRFSRYDGRMMFFRIHFYYLGKKEGRERFYGSAIDETELYNLKETKNLISEFSKDNLIFVYRVVDKWRYTVISHGLADIVGLAPQELEEELNTGRFAQRVVNQRDLKQFMKETNENAEKKKDFAKEFVILDKNHNKVKIRLTFTCVSDSANNVEYIMKTEKLD